MHWPTQLQNINVSPSLQQFQRETDGCYHLVVITSTWGIRRGLFMRDAKSSKRGGDITLMFDCLLDDVAEEDLKEVFSEFFVSDRQTMAAGAGGNRSNQIRRALTHARRQIQRRGQDRTLRR